MRTFTLIITISIAALAAGAARADDEDLLGRWKTPGGNIVSVADTTDGKLEGHLSEVTEEAKAVGFTEDELALRNIKVAGNVVDMQVGVRADDPKHPCPAHFIDFHGTIDTNTLSGDVKDGGFDDSCNYIEKDTTTGRLEYTRDMVPCLVDFEPKDVVEIHRYGDAGADKEVTIVGTLAEPLAPEHSPLAVEARRLGSGEAARVTIVWTVTSKQDVHFSATYYTETDPEGRAELRFGLMPNGEFMATNQIQSQPTRTVPAGSFLVTAALDTPLKTLTPVNFGLVLERAGVWLNFVSQDGAQGVTSLALDPKKVAFKLELVDFDDKDAADKKTVRLASRLSSKPSPGADAISVELSRVGAGIYRYEKMIAGDSNQPSGSTLPASVVAYPKSLNAELKALFATVLLLPDPGSNKEDDFVVEAYVADRLVGSLTIYQYPERRRKEYLESLIQQLKRKLTALNEGVKPGDVSSTAQIERRQSLLDRAHGYLLDAELGKIDHDIQINLATQYLQLVSRRDDLNGPGGTYSFTRIGYVKEVHNVDDWTLRKFTYDYANERTALDNAHTFYLDTKQKNLDSNAAALLAQLGLDQPADKILSLGTVITLARGIASLALSQELSFVYGVHLLATGITLDGDPANGGDYWGAGLDVAAFEFHSTIEQRLAQAVSKKVDRLKQIYAADRSLVNSVRTFRQLTADERAMVTEYERVAEAIDGRLLEIARAVAENKITGDLGGRLIESFKRVVNKQTARRVAARMKELTAGVAGVTVSRRDLGNIEHLVKRYENVDFNEAEVALGRRTQVAPGHWSWTERGVTYHEFIEYQLPNGKRVDHALAAVDPTGKNSFLRVTDLAAQLNKTHFRKGLGYLTQFDPVLPALKAAHKSYCEFYWDEQADKLLEKHVASQ
jgi:hypothetical protein